MDVTERTARVIDLEAKIKQAETWTWMQQYVPHMKTELAVHQEHLAEAAKKS